MKKSLFTLLGLCIAQLALCQANPDNFAKMVDFLPPPPNAAAITKAGLISLNKNTGAPSISIPLYNIKGRNLGMEVSLSYSSNGIKVDEIASRVGMGWAINAGGVVTRTVKGVQDELNTRLLPAGNFGENWPTYSFFNNIATATPSGSYDGEPDLFNFSVDGVSGSFVFDENMQVVLVPHNNVKIEYNFNSTVWNFKLTGPDGTKYYFGGNTATETTKRMQTCGKTFGAYIPTAWYLKKIEHLNGEVITFNYTALDYSYDTGISETRTYTNGSAAHDVYSTPFGCGEVPPPGGPGWGISICKNYVNTRGVLLDEIVTDNYAKIKFNYTTRPDDNDKLISSIVETDLTTNTNIRSFSFSYTNNATATYANYQGEGFTVPYLNSLTENSADNLQTKTHYFIYDDPTARPCRLSYAQDHWGFFNGKNNSMLVPKIDELSYMFPLVTANRNPDFNFTTKGMLKKIVYPTGGIQTIEYEPNIVRGFTTDVPLHTHSCQVTGTGPQVTVSKMIPFTITNQQFQWLKIHLASSCNPGNTCDGIHDFSRVDLKDANGNIVFTQGLFPDQSIDFTIPSTGGGSFSLILSAIGRVSSGVTVDYQPVSTTNQNADITSGGLRVKAILTGNPNEKPMLKKYYYGEMQSLDVSTLGAQRDPAYLNTYKTSQAWYTPAATNMPPLFCAWAILYNALHSNSLSNLFDYNNQIASYGSVVEGIGENFEGGATQSKFNVTPDEGAITTWGSKMLNAPAVNTALALNGKPTEETIFKKNGSGQLIPVSKKAYSYNVTSMRQIPGYVVNKFRTFPFTPNQNTVFTPNIENMYALYSFDVMKYYVYSPWTVTETETDSLFDENGANPLTSTTTNHYTNNVHLQLTSSETVNSKNETITTINKYPQDYGSSSVYADMTDNHVITPVVDTRVTNTAINNDVAEVKNNYADWGNGNYNIATIQKSVKGNSLEDLGTITKRDTYGNIIEFRGKDGITSSVIWGYKNTYPVAKIANADYDLVIPQLSVTMAALQSMDGSALLTELNRIRTGLPAAQVTTYTYKPLVGVTSITDPNNKTNTYQYDVFSRLMVIKDQDNNVVKKMDYQYAGGNPQSVFNIYFNDEQQGYFTCQHCAAGYTTSSTSYSVAAGRFYSLVSVQDANAKAQAYLQLNGPVYAEEYARTHAMCFNSYCPAAGPNCTTSNCTGENKKCISNICETGSRIYISTVYDRNTGLWTCTYYYKFSDNSTNPADAPTTYFTETNNYGCAVTDN